MWGLLRTRWMVDGGGDFWDFRMKVLKLFGNMELSFHSCRYNAGNNAAKKERTGLDARSVETCRTITHSLTHSSPTTCVSCSFTVILMGGNSVPSVCICFRSTRSVRYIL